MSGPQGSEPTRPWSPPSESQQPAGREPDETPWWQQVRRGQPPTPGYPPQPQSPPYQQAPPQQTPYSAPQYAQQPTPYSYQQPAPAAPAAQPNHTTRWLLIGGGALVGVIAAVVLALVLLGLDVFDRQELNVTKAQEDVKQVITDPVTGYGVANVTTVRCNNGENPTAKEGDSFTCEVTVDGKKREVRAVFIDDNGTYEVDRPR